MPVRARTDRHNNPTAFTTAIAKQAGLLEGVDYEPGDPFGLRNEHNTARLLGDADDAIRTTIRVIDTIGFYTKEGRQRWDYIGMPFFVWEALNAAQRRRVIGFMYSREGGGELLPAFPRTPEP